MIAGWSNPFEHIGTSENASALPGAAATAAAAKNQGRIPLSDIACLVWPGRRLQIRTSFRLGCNTS
jgi:hypothetical protein